MEKNRDKKRNQKTMESTQKNRKQILCALTKKLHAASGETLTEVLVASLVVVLGSILLATMVLASYRMIRRSEEAYDKFLADENAFESQGTWTVNGEGNKVNSKSDVTNYMAQYKGDAEGKVIISWGTENNETVDVTLNQIVVSDGAGSSGESDSTPATYSYTKKSKQN